MLIEACTALFHQPGTILDKGACTDQQTMALGVCSYLLCYFSISLCF